MAAKKSNPRSRAQAKPRSTKTPAGGTAKSKKPRAVGGRSRRRSAAGDDELVDRIQRVIEVMLGAGAVEVEMRDGDSRLRVRLKEERPIAPAVPFAAGGPAVSVPPIAAPTGPAASAAKAPGGGTDDLYRVVFKSPMVGTFYRSPSPDADPFVQIGDRVVADTTICILEAMKVMNEIKAELEGEVVEVLAQSGEPVEFGQPLFVIKVA